MGILLPDLLTLALALPCVQQLENGRFDLHGGIGAREVFAELFTGQRDVGPFRFLLLRHDLKHGVLIQFPGLTEFFHALGLGERGGSLLTVDCLQKQGLFLGCQGRKLIRGGSGRFSYRTPSSKAPGPAV